MFFISVRFPGRKKSNDSLTFSKAMTDYENPQLETHPKQDEAIFIFRMIRVEELYSILIIKGRASFIEGNTMFSYIGLFLPIIPLETQFVHMYIVRIM
jgi:hypothetical protein